MSDFSDAKSGFADGRLASSSLSVGGSSEAAELRVSFQLIQRGQLIDPGGGGGSLHAPPVSLDHQRLLRGRSLLINVSAAQVMINANPISWAAE